MSETPHLVDATMFWNASGGVRRYVLAKRRWMQRNTDWCHSIATPANGDTQPRSLDVPSLPLPGSGGAYRLAWRRGACARVLSDARPDLIESGDAYRLAWASLDAARHLRVPAVAFCHSNLERMGAMLAGRHGAACARRYARHLYRRFDLVLAPSHAMVAHLRDWGVPGAQHQPLGVDTGVFDPARRNSGLRSHLGLRNDARLLVFAGRFAPEKNLQTLADATRRLGPRYWLLAVGAGTAPPEGDRVIVLPAVRAPESLASLIAACDLFVHAGDQETFGLSVLEAMACGVPVVARRAEGLAELVDGSVGRAVEQGSADAFAEAIDDAFCSDLDALGRAARQRAEAHQWDRVLPSLWVQYRRLLGTAAPTVEPVWQAAVR